MVLKCTQTKKKKKKKNWFPVGLSNRARTIKTGQTHKWTVLAQSRTAHVAQHNWSRHNNNNNCLKEEKVSREKKQDYNQNGISLFSFFFKIYFILVWLLVDRRLRGQAGLHGELSWPWSSSCRGAYSWVCGVGLWGGGWGLHCPVSFPQHVVTGAFLRYMRCGA